MINNRIMISVDQFLIFLLLTFEWVNGTKIGDLSSRSHGLAGTVHIIDHKKIMIVGFSYDGESRDAYFYAGTIKHSLMPNGNDGVQLQFPEGSNDALKRYTNENITIKVPKDLDTSDIRWLTVWSKKHSSNFGDIMFQNLMYTDDSDNNNNNNDVLGDDDDEYNNNPDTQGGHHSQGNVLQISFATIASFSLLLSIL